MTMTAERKDVQECTLNLIPADKVGTLVSALAPLISGLVERSSGRWTASGIIGKWTDGTWQCWIIWDGSIKAVMATQIYVEMSGMRICDIIALTGADSLDWLHLVDDLEGWARAQNCARLQGVMRKGWAKRLSDFSLSHVMLEKDLR